MKGNEDLIRIVAIAAAFLVMFGIIGIAIYSINNVDTINQKHREEEEGKNIAASIVQTTATTSVWDLLRATEETTETADSALMDGSSLQNGEEMQENTAESENTTQTVTTTVPVIDITS